MAFAFQQESNNNFFGIITTILLVIAIVGGGYMLFFAKEPLIDIAIPNEVEKVSELSKVSFKGIDFSKNETFLSLQPQVSELEMGEVGRANPFAPF